MMADSLEDHYVEVFGDGSYTTPEKWWAAIGGMGVWMPDWNGEGESIEHRMETHVARPKHWANGQLHQDGVCCFDHSVNQAYKKQLCHG